MKTVIIGSGNIATHLGKALQDKGFEILQVISQNKNHAKQLAQKLNCEASDDINSIVKAELYLIAANDNAIETVVKKFGVELEREVNIYPTPPSGGWELAIKRTIK